MPISAVKGDPKKKAGSNHDGGSEGGLAAYEVRPKFCLLDIYTIKK